MKLIYIIMNHFKFLLNNFLFIIRYGIEKKNISISLKFSSIFVIHYFRKVLLFRKYKNEKFSFKSLIIEKKFSNDWFTENIPSWVYLFKQINSKNEIKCLEIGSYEGMSALFSLTKLSNSKIDCVETFQGSDEHSKLDFSKVEKNFNYNLSNFKDRYQIFKMTSDDFFKDRLTHKMYDFIYIDGSHFSEQVYRDAINSFRFLNTNGIIIFDDFLKKFYKKIDQNPINGVISFIKEKKKQIKIMDVGYQICIKKII